MKTQLNSILSLLDDGKVKEMLSRDFSFCTENPKGGILLTGFNPSYVQSNNCITNGLELYSFSSTNYNVGYWKRAKALVEGLINVTAYLDLFPIRESDQELFVKTFTENDFTLSILGELLGETQQEIENISPKLIISMNRYSQAFWGRNNDCVWMGYEFEKVENPIQGKEIDLCRIIGFKDDPKDERVYKAEQSNLVGSLIVFYGLYDNRHEATCPERLLSAEDVKVLYEMAKE